METALENLKGMKDSYRALIVENFEFNAKNCDVCETKGACCLDEHFVNVHITELEAEAVLRTVKGKGKLDAVIERNRKTIAQYDLKDGGDTYKQTFACPLFEKEAGCLVHNEAKPTPCISHACYENKEDLPPQFLQDRIERKIEALNKDAYDEFKWLPLPLWLERMAK